MSQRGISQIDMWSRTVDGLEIPDDQKIILGKMGKILPIVFEVEGDTVQFMVDLVQLRPSLANRIIESAEDIENASRLNDALGAA